MWRWAIVAGTPLLEGAVDAVGVESFLGAGLGGIEWIPGGDLVGEGMEPSCSIGDIPGVEVRRAASWSLLAS